MTRRALEELPSHECFALLRTQRVGRLVYQDELGPAAVPVTYAVAGEDILFRSMDGSKIRALAGHDVAFEVDHVDDAAQSGWSVLVRGAGEIVELEHVPALLGRVEGDPPLPWKTGVHGIWAVIRAKRITGRRLGDPASDLVF
jgi:nitroimidazol reductase NimA-like FMN-containing flavoprotein (pyridoxamine 5'-phosphate oxidase superfamily)